MNLFSGNCVKYCRCIAECLCTTSITVSAASLATVGLVVLAILSNSACSPSVTETPPERTRPIPTPTETPTAPVMPTPTPTLLPPVTLEAPEDGACLGCESPVTLRWSCPYELQTGDCFRLKVKGQNSSVLYLTEQQFTLPAFSPGDYNWAVAVVRSTDPDVYVEVSEESETYRFEIAPPAPVVHSISPTCTVQGTNVTVVVSGDNLTHSLALTIGVPLTATFVNSRTITTTVPDSLEVGDHPVIVKDSIGQGVSSVSFTVDEPASDLPPAVSPWNPATPIPSAAPQGYDPHKACIVKCCAPAPRLTEPENEAEVRYSSALHLKWMWDYCLPPGWQFAVRISLAADPLHSHQYVDNPKLISCKDGKSFGDFPVGKEFTEKPGTYHWNIAVVRSLGNEKWERLSEESGARLFIVESPDNGGNGCPVPPCD